MSKKHVAVLMGGISSEHDVSIKSGTMVAGSLNRSRFEVTPIVITRKGQWKFPGEERCPLHEALHRLIEMQVDCVFIALHGPFGEDGRIQGMLDLLDLPYTGSGCASSAAAIDKTWAKTLVESAGVRVARHILLRRAQWDADPKETTRRVESEIGFPCVVKSPCQGSSLGMAISRSVEAFRDDLLPVFAFGDRVLIEVFEAGVEVTCGVLDVEPGTQPLALPVTEIAPVTSPYFDYYAKYTPGACEEITPARIPAEAASKVQEAALRAHEALGCRGLSRSDMILQDGEPVWFEINTIPGMTETSLFPQAAAAHGIPFPDLVEKLVESSLTWKHINAEEHAV